MMRRIDNILNRITMYRVVLYYLICLWCIALLFGIFGILPYGPADMIFSAGLILFICWITNEIFKDNFEAPVNVESVYITAAILALIITPVSISASNFYDKLWFIVWASVWAIASKFILAVRKKHIFNPAAFGVALTAIAINQSARWWIGTIFMLPFVLAGGILLVRKILRWDLVWSFFIAAFASIIFLGLMRGTNPLTSFQKAIFESPIFFFAFVMLTEPLTTPPTRFLRIMYGVFVGLIFSPSFHVGSIYSTPELALLAGNVVSYLISPKTKLTLSLRRKTQLTPDVYNFIFTADRRMKFKPGQYLEWTMPNSTGWRTDSRGNRRHFTIASSPTEPNISMGVKFYPQASSFKRALFQMRPGEKIIASQLAGDFVMPSDKNKKLVFIAGGIGITPFRSMVKYLMDKRERRDIVLLYSAKTVNDFAYNEIFEEGRAIGLRPVYFATSSSAGSASITAQTIMEEVPDYKDRIFYISGPRSMVLTFKDALKNAGVERGNIKTDFFPGFA